MRLATIGVLAACSAPTRPPAPPPATNGSAMGTAADVQTRDGAYDGYRVTRQCRDRDCFGVSGAGSSWWPGMERDRIDEDARFREGFELFRAATTAAIEAGGVRTLHSSALGGGCSMFGLVFGLTSWRELDVAIARSGELLRSKDLREEITICVNAGYVIPIGEH